MSSFNGIPLSELQPNSSIGLLPRSLPPSHPLVALFFLPPKSKTVGKHAWPRGPPFVPAAPSALNNCSPKSNQPLCAWRLSLCHLIAVAPCGTWPHILPAWTHFFISSEDCWRWRLMSWGVKAYMFYFGPLQTENQKQVAF